MTESVGIQTKSKLKCFYESAAITPKGVDARHRDGRRASQVQRAFLSPSVSAAIRLIDEFGWNRNYVKTYLTVENDVPEFLTALNDHDPGTILIRPLNPGDTIDGTDGWRPYVKEMLDVRK